MQCSFYSRTNIQQLICMAAEAKTTKPWGLWFGEELSHDFIVFVMRDNMSIPLTSPEAFCFTINHIMNTRHLTFPSLHNVI